MNAWATVFVAVLAATVLHQTTANDSRPSAEHGKGVVHIADAASNTRSLLAKDLAPAPAPAEADSPSPSKAAGPAVVRNVTTLATLYGNAYNPNYDITGESVTSGKNKAAGYMCVIFGSDIRGSCENEERPVPSCCSSQGGDAVCNTFDNGGRVTCTLPDQPYPACCENRNQPRSVCTLPASDTSCGNDYPVPSCCDSTFCTVFKSGNSVKCEGSNVARCCPS